MRTDYISWQDYFMGIAKLSAMRSKDPSTQVGACIVDQNNKIVSVGYNGMPYGIDDATANWGKLGEWQDTKYPYVCHAELNAILNSPRSVVGCRIFVTHHPCNECAKAIVQSGIKEVIYEDSKPGKTSDVAGIIFEYAGVSVTKYQTQLDKIVIDF